MQPDSYYLITYAAAWISILVFYLWKSKQFGIGGFLLTSYSISSLATILFYETYSLLPYFPDANLSWGPLSYLFILINLCILPFILKSKQLSSLNFEISEKGVSFLKSFVLLMSPFIIEAFLEITYIAMSTNTSSFGSIYESDADTVGNQLSFLGRKTMALVRWFQYVWPVIFFVMLKKGAEYRKFAIFAAIACLCGLLEAYAGSSRVAIVRPLMYYVIIYLLFKQSLTPNIRHKINRILSIGGPLLVGGLILISVVRFNYSSNGDNEMWAWFALYLGEGPVRFCMHMWDITKLSNGDTCFGLIRYILGYDTFLDFTIREDVYERVIGIPQNIFYTFVGDLYQDMGRLNTILFCILLSCLGFKSIKSVCRNGYLSFSRIILLSMFLLLYEFGFMYMTYKSPAIQSLLVPNFLFLIVYRFVVKEK